MNKHVKLEKVVLHGTPPLFLGGSNLGLQIETDRRKDVTMIYDRQEKELHISLVKQVAGKPKTYSVILPYTSAFAMFPVDEQAEQEKAGVPKEVGPVPKKGKVTAQVSTPMSHVFAGEKNGVN